MKVDQAKWWIKEAAEQQKGRVPVAIVWRGPYSDEGVVEHGLVALHDQLMCARDQCQFVDGVELADHVAAKQIARTAWAQAPAVDVYASAHVSVFTSDTYD